MILLTWLVAILMALVLLVLAAMVFNIYQVRDLLGLTRQSFDALHPDPMASPFPVDPERLPKVVDYDGSLPHLRCVCHDEQLRAGSTVMLFPVPDSDEMRIVCERAIPRTDAS